MNNRNVDQKPALEAIIWTPVVVSTLFVATRVLVRAKLKTIGTEEHLMLLSAITFFIAACLTQAIIDVPIFDYPGLERWNLETDYADVFIYLTVALGKSSIGMQLLRIFGDVSTWRRGLIVFCIGLQVLLTVLTLPFSNPAICNLGTVPSPSNKCLSSTIAANIGSAYNVSNAFVDITFSILPASFVLKLQASVRKKALTVILLGLGWTAGAFAIIREVLNRVGEPAPYVFTSSNWLEQGLVIICGSLAAIAPLFRHWKLRRPWRSIGADSGQDIRDYRRNAGPLSPVRQREMSQDGGEEPFSLGQTSGDGDVPTMRMFHEFNEDSVQRICMEV